ncbi:MAG: porin family protein [Tenuifilaceae bacterium]
MKKVLIIPFLLLFALTSNAQLFKIFGQEVGYIYVGPKFGGTFSKMSNADESFTFPGASSTIKYKSGLQFGIAGKFGFTSRFSIQPEIMFFQKGVSYDITAGTGKYKTSYIGIPILAKFALAQVGIIKFHIDGGVYSNVRTGGESTFEDAATGQTSTYTLDNAGWRRMDYGVMLGGGFEYPREKGTWVFDLRYDYSFVDAHISDATYNSNSTFGISATYLFDVVDFFFRMKNKKKEKDNNEGGSQEKPGLKVDRSKD